MIRFDKVFFVVMICVGIGFIFGSIFKGRRKYLFEVFCIERMLVELDLYNEFFVGVE